LLEASGPYHRFLAVNRPEKLYAVEPGQPIPALAYIQSGCDPKFGPSVSASLRAAALLASFQTGLKMTEETVDGVTIVSYRFPEKGELPADTANIRFNFAPCFAVVGDSFIIASHPGLLKDLLPELKQPARTGSPAVWRGRAFAEGGAGLLRANPDPTITATILNTGVGLDEAKRQTGAFIDWIQTLGQYELSLDHGQNAFALRFEWSIK
jgi:hypothetical protein